MDANEGDSYTTRRSLSKFFKKNCYVTYMTAYLPNKKNAKTHWDERELMQLSKVHLVNLYLKLQYERDTHLCKCQNDMKRLLEQYERIESALSVANNINRVLHERVLALEKELHEVRLHECMKIRSLLRTNQHKFDFNRMVREP